MPATCRPYRATQAKSLCLWPPVVVPIGSDENVAAQKPKPQGNAMKHVAVLALLGSLALHGLGFGIFGAPDDISQNGGAPSTTARLGTSFADLAAGTLTPVTQSHATKASRVDPIETVPTIAPAAAVQAMAARTVAPVQPDTTRTTIQTEAIRPLLPRANTPTPTPAVAATPETHTSAPSSSTREIAATVPEVNAPDQNTERPRPRPQPPAVVTGNSTRDALRGAQVGQRDGAATTPPASARQTASRSGSEAATNYPGRVWAKLSRGARSGSNGRGSVVVSFRVGASGALARAGVVRSSGNARLDRAALEYVRRASPFPAPPAGAETQFNFTYEAR